MFLAFFLALIAGLVVGYFMMTKFLIIGFCILGGLAGFFFGGLLYNLLLIQWI